MKRARNAVGPRERAGEYKGRRDPTHADARPTGPRPPGRMRVQPHPHHPRGGGQHHAAATRAAVPQPSGRGAGTRRRRAHGKCRAQWQAAPQEQPHPQHP
eukprot:10771136-Alexandrium_andersonii.AAC.1